VGGRAGGDAWAWLVDLQERPTICTRVGRKTRSVTEIKITFTHRDMLHSFTHQPIAVADILCTKSYQSDINL
jgi:hypothetical protein